MHYICADLRVWTNFSLVWNQRNLYALNAQQGRDREGERETERGSIWLRQALRNATHGKCPRNCARQTPLYPLPLPFPLVSSRVTDRFTCWFTLGFILRFTLGQRGRFHVQSNAAFHLTFIRGVGEQAKRRGARGPILTRPQLCRTSGCFNRVRGQSQEHKALQSTAHFSDNY